MIADLRHVLGQLAVIAAGTGCAVLVVLVVLGFMLGGHR